MDISPGAKVHYCKTQEIIVKTAVFTETTDQ